MKDSNKYDPNDAPVSGPFAGLDPEQQPVIVDKHGQRVREQNETWGAADDGNLVTLLAELCAKQIVMIECASDRPLHRLVIGDGNFRSSLATALTAALAHHAKTG